MSKFIALFKKELRCELRSAHGWISGLVFGVLAVVMTTLGGRVTAADQLFTVILFFVAAVTVPRLFLIEEDQRTLELLRMMAPAGVTFFAKLAVCLLQMLVLSVSLSIVFCLLSGFSDRTLWLVLNAIVVGSAATIGFASSAALSLGAENRSLIAGVAGIPLLLPATVMCRTLVAHALGVPTTGTAEQSLLGLSLYSFALLALTPIGVEAMWGRDKPAPINRK